MKILASLMVLLSFSVPKISAPPKPLPEQVSSRASHPHGKWYLAENGHAVYCFGPVRVIDDPIAGMQRVATFCKGDRLVVPLKD
ncbi:MAG TPA: hypothetical protein VMB18_11060 [Terriglobales bacterium]|nr:hypothetical protein [Terriglobales bacterium]